MGRMYKITFSQRLADTGIDLEELERILSQAAQGIDQVIRAFLLTANQPTDPEFLGVYGSEGLEIKLREALDRVLKTKLQREERK